MDYCSGIWGRQNNDNILKVHNRAIRCFLGVNKYAPIAGFQGDMGRPAYPYDFRVLCTFFAPIVRLYAQQRLLYDII